MKRSDKRFRGIIKEFVGLLEFSEGVERNGSELYICFTPPGLPQSSDARLNLKRLDADFSRSLKF